MNAPYAPTPPRPAPELSPRDRATLAGIFQKGRLITREDGQLEAGAFNEYGWDRSRRGTPAFDILAMPGDTEETAQVIRFARERGIGIVPSGGRTGLAGGALAARGEIVLSLERMNRVLDFDPHLPALRVEAGLITRALQQAAEERGYFYPVDFAASGSSHIGGNIATNAGGIRVIKYGMTREWVAGLTVVTGTGEILRFPGEILKNNTGVDLKQAFIGSEGILGVITEATLRLTRPPAGQGLALFALDSFTKVITLLKRARADLDLSAFEYFDARCLRLTREHLQLRAPFPEESPCYVLVEFIAPGSLPAAEFIATYAQEKLGDLIVDAAAPETAESRRNFWSYREGISESLSLGHVVHKNDVSLPVRKMETFLADLREILREEGEASGIHAREAIFGHLGDGNLHVNLIKPEEASREDFHAFCAERLDARVYERIQSLGGSISAEHGIGILKKAHLGFSRSPEEIRLMRELKRIFDPDGILNPGKVLPEQNPREKSPRARIDA